MRLYLEKKDSEEKDKENYLDISFWSFVKCHFLASLGVSIIVAGIFILLYILLLILNFTF